MTSPVCIPNKPLLGSCLSERVRCTGIKMADDEYDKLKDAHEQSISMKRFLSAIQMIWWP